MTTYRRCTSVTLSLGLALSLALAGCTGQAPPASQSAPAATAPSRALPEQPAGVSAVELRKRAQRALRDQRIYAPAGDNAIELYVALRGGSTTPDPDAQGALMELQPYAVIGAEQALARGDLLEAERLRQLVAATDPVAPSLGRIADAIAAQVGTRAQQARDLTAAGVASATTELTE